MSVLGAVEFKVGLLVAVVAGLVAFMSMQVSEKSNYLGGSRKAWFVVSDASGLVKNSGVKMAGINIGIIKDIRLQNGLARVDMVLDADVPLTNSARIEIRANGILGDKHIEVVAGDENDLVLEEGGQIFYVEDRGSIQALLTQMGRISKVVGDVANTMRNALKGDGNTGDSFGRVMRNLENLTTDISEMASDNKKDVRSMVKEFKRVSKTLDGFINNESDNGFKAAWSKAVESLSRIDRTLQNTAEITDKINSGEGTLGRLVNDSQTVDELNEAIEGVNNLLGSGYRLQTSIDFYTNHYPVSNISKSTLGVKIQPGLDRYYYLGVVDDPTGVREVTEKDTETIPGDSVSTIETVTFRNKVKLTALFAKNFYDFTVKGGLIENTGGFGIDYHMFRQKFKFSMEALDFSYLNLRLSAKMDIYKGIYIHGGVDDVLGKKKSDYFGIGLFLTNDDLKLLATGASF